MFRHVGLWLGLLTRCLSIASKPAPGKSRSPATAGRADAQASQTPDWSGLERLTKSSGYSPVVFGVLGSSLSCSVILIWWVFTMRGMIAPRAVQHNGTSVAGYR